MATKQRTVDYLLEQATGAGAVSTKPMFGGYGVYVDGMMIGSICAVEDRSLEDPDPDIGWCIAPSPNWPFIHLDLTAGPGLAGPTGERGLMGG